MFLPIPWEYKVQLMNNTSTMAFQVPDILIYCASRCRFSAYKISLSRIREFGSLIDSFSVYAAASEFGLL